MYANFALTLYAFCALIVYKLEKRKHFWHRLIPCSLMYLAIGPVWGQIAQRLFHSPGGFNPVFLIYVLGAVLIICFCFKTRFVTSVFYTSIAYTFEHISTILFRLLVPMVRFPSQLLKNSAQLALTALILIVVYWFLICREGPVSCEPLYLYPKVKTLIVSVAAFAVTYGLSSYADILQPQGNASDLMAFYALCASMLLLMVQFGIFTQSKVEEEKLKLESMMDAEHRQHLLSKENIEMIHMKCHDLKQQVYALRFPSSDDNRERQLKRIEELADIYETEYNTGNTALDVILTEKSLLCSKYHIKAFTMIDSTGLSMMEEVDIYSLFGNILDNAIEYLQGVQDESLREICLRIGKRRICF